MVGTIKSVWKSKCGHKKKPWGEETSWLAPWGVYGKVIKLEKGSRTSLKYYTRKNEVLFCLKGRAIVTAPEEREFGEVGPAGSNFYLEPGEVLFIENQNPYRIKAVTDCLLIEVTAGGHHGTNDSVMLEDDFGRVKKNSKSVSDIIK